jgi:hypothetical protein
MWTPEEARRKIAALFAKAKGTSNPAEAMAFAQKAAEMGRQYGIDPASTDPDRVTKGLYKTGNKAAPVWKAYLAQAAARLNRCHLYRTFGGVVFVGREGDRITAELMFDFFVKAADKATRTYMKGPGRDHWAPRRLSSGFRNGFALEVLKRAAEAVPENPATLPEIAEVLKAANLRYRRTSVNCSEAGRQAGRSVGLNRQAMGGQTLALAAR